MGKKKAVRSVPAQIVIGSAAELGFMLALTAVMAALVIVFGMKLVGSLLITALIVFPVLGAMRLYKSFLAVTVCAGIFALIAALGGFLASLAFSTPVGATMAAADMVLFGICALIGRVRSN